MIRDILKSIFRPAPEGDDGLTVTVLGTDFRQTTKAVDLSFGLLLEGGGEAVLVDPGPDVARQVLRRCPDVGRIKAVVVTHDGVHHRRGLEIMKGLGWDGDVVHADDCLNAAAACSRLGLAGATWMPVEVPHEAASKCVGLVGRVGDFSVLIAPHLRKAVGFDAEGAKRRVVLTGVGPASGSDPEYLSPAAVKAFDAETYLVGYVVDGDGDGPGAWDAMEDAGATALRTGGRLTIKGSTLAAYPPESDAAESVVVPGYVSVLATGGEPLVVVLDGGVSDEVLAAVKAMAADGVEVRPLEDGDDRAALVPVYDLVLKGAVPRVTTAPAPTCENEPAADPDPSDDGVEE